MKILFKYASRSRQIKFFKGLDCIYNNLSDKENFNVIVSCDEDDFSMNNDFTIQRLNTYKNLSYHFGNSKTKIEAINADMNIAPEYDVLIVMSDDMQFIQKGFDDIIRKDMIEQFPEIDGALHYPDGFTGNRCITMTIMGKILYDRFNYIYHPDYISLYCDSEFTEVTKMLGKYAYIHKQLFLHNHPIWKRAEYDEQYRHTESFYSVDKATFEKRKSINFEL